MHTICTISSIYLNKTQRLVLYDDIALMSILSHLPLIATSITYYTRNNENAY